MKGFALFLNFNGVLPAIRSQSILGLYRHADRLGTVLSRHPDVRVIVSSTWREIYSLEAMRACCGPILGPRLIDATPVHRRNRNFHDRKPRLRLRLDGHAAIARLYFRADDENFHQRFEEIALWLAVHASPSLNGRSAADSASSRDDWIALDDNATWFPPGCQQLIHVDGGHGLTVADLAMLEARLAHSNNIDWRTNATND